MSNDEYQQQHFFGLGMYNLSKNFKDFEIKGITYIDGKRVLYLKEGVKRKHYNDDVNGDEITHINQDLINYERFQAYYQLILGIDDFSNDN